MKQLLTLPAQLSLPRRYGKPWGRKPGQPPEIRVADGRLEIEIAPIPAQLKKRGKGVVAVPDADLPALTSDQVRDTLEQIRR